MLLELDGGLPFSYSGDWSARGRSTGWDGNWRLQGSEGSLHLEKDALFLGRSERWASKNSKRDPAVRSASRDFTVLTD